MGTKIFLLTKVFIIFLCLLNPNFIQKLEESNGPIIRKRHYSRTAEGLDRQTNLNS